MSCQVEQIADCGDLSTLARALFIPEKEDENWLCQCCLSLSSCGNVIAVGYRSRLCLLSTQWISSTDSNTYLISWSGTLCAEITAVLAVPICPSHQSSQNGPDWFCIIVGFINGKVGFYTNTGHLLLLEKLEEKPVMKITCHTGTYGTLPDDIHILFHNCECIIAGASLFQTLRNAKAQLARVQAGLQENYSVDSKSIGIRKWMFSEQDNLNDAAVVGLELKNSYDHLLAASTYGGYDTWYRSVPPMNTLILGAGETPYIGFHYALEGGANPPLQDVARAVANKIKSALPGWLGGGAGSTEAARAAASAETVVRWEPLSMRSGLFDDRVGVSVAVSPDRRLAAVTDNVGRVAVLDVHRGHLIRLFKGCRDAQCAFVQVFDIDNKKPQLSVVKELKRAVFLIIYNPKKGLIDIRLMQRGTRLAAFTATKNGQLIYNTCGLVGAEKNFSHKKLNLPEFQCVLIDPDGKLKKFNIPFFYALEGDNSDRSKDLHNLRALRDCMKQTCNTPEQYESEILARVSTLKTLDLKKYCLDILIKKYSISPKIIMSCLEVFWDSLEDVPTSDELEATKRYFANVALITLFYRQINNENTNDMSQLMTKIRNGTKVDDDPDAMVISKEGEQALEFELLEDDSCIIERLLVLAQESGYKEHHQTRVTFADNSTNNFKEFVSCFDLRENSSHYISLKTDTSPDKLNNLASDAYKLIFGIKNMNNLTKFVKDSNIDPKEIVKLVILHIMNMPLEGISIMQIEKLVEVLYYLCRVSEEATNMEYSEISPWWESIRNMLVQMPCPLRSMIVAMACKAVGKICENTSIEATEAWESVSKENAKWGILIGKLEDISLLSIILMFKATFTGNALLKLRMTDININLKYIYTRGKGSITELIAKWLCGMGVLPEAIVVNELMERYTGESETSNDDSPEYLFLQNNRALVDDNPNIFKWLSLLRRQFPLSTCAAYIVANMCWEYAAAWQTSIQNTEYLFAVTCCLHNITDLYLRSGVYSIIWSTYIKNIFESTCRLVNKVGRLPKDPLCIQDVGLNNIDMVKFLKLATNYLEEFLNCSKTSNNQTKQVIQYEKIWDESMPSLVEVAQDTKQVNSDVLTINYQIACTIYYMCHYNVKCSKPLDTLFDVDYQYILDALIGNVLQRDLNMTASDKLANPRMKYLTKLIRAAVETISCEDSEEPIKTYNDKECILWMDRITSLAELWNIDEHFIRRQQIIALYHMGYDSLVEPLLKVIREPFAILPPLLAISTQRLKQNHAHSADPKEWIVTVPPHLYKRLQNTELDTSIPAHPCLGTTMEVMQNLLYQIENKTNEALTPNHVQNVKLARLIIDTCEVLQRRKL